MLKKLQAIKDILKRQGFNVEIKKMYGVYILEFDITGLRMSQLSVIRDVFHFKNLLDDSFMVAHYPGLSSSICIKTNILIDEE